MSRLTSWQIGGPAEYVYWPQSNEDVVRVFEVAGREHIPVWLLGRGTNILAPDEGLAGLVVVTTGLREIEWGEYRIRVAAGYQLARLAAQAAERGWSGLEFARGIPGTVGGAVVMNAGAHGGEIASLVKEVEAWHYQTGVRVWTGHELEFGYRQCRLRGQAVVLSVELELKPGDKEKIGATMAEYLLRRRSSQPLEWPNAGSVFRNPPGEPAGKLIEKAGWKGYRVGGAQVSEKHANFIVNTGNAKASDVLALIEMIQNDVEAKFRVRLVAEVECMTARG